MHIQNFNLLRIYALATLLLSSIVFSDEPIVIDVRSLEEVKTGIIQDAIHIEWKQIDEEIRKVEKEIGVLKKSAPEKINKIAIETSSELLKKLIGADVNSSSISAIVDDLSKKNGDKYYGN